MRVEENAGSSRALVQEVQCVGKSYCRDEGYAFFHE